MKSLSVFTIALAALLLSASAGTESKAARPAPARTITTPASLERAVKDLVETFGKEYPRGKEYLARLKNLEGKKDQAALDKLAREALLDNPLLDFDKLLVVKRKGNLGLPNNWVGNCALGAGGFNNEIALLSSVQPGGKLTTIYRPERPVFVGDVDLHWDAKKMLFSMPGKDKRYQVLEIGVDGKGLRQVSPSIAGVDNYDACYLPNEKIIFDSSACLQGVPCVGGASQVANLYIMNPDGTGMRRLCFDQDHDWYPSVMNDGRVIFTRWEYSDSPHYFTRVVMIMNPDGTSQRSYYGSNSYWPNSTFYPRAIPGHPSQFIGVISGHHGVARQGELILFDPARGQQEADGVVQRIPGHGKKVEPIIRDQLVNGSWPSFLHPYPLSGKYFLAACKPDPARPWGIYLVDVFDNILPICVEAGVHMLEPVPFRKTPRPPVIPDRVDLSRKDALVSLSDIYVGDGLKDVPRGTVKRLRIYAFDYGYHRLANHTYVGIEGPWDVRRILGTVDVEDDGSALFRVPANTPIAVQPLDKEGMALQLMRSWMVAMPGENLSCVGCHERNNTAPPARVMKAMRKAPQDIKPWFGPARGFSFVREVQPALDKSCIGCHNGTPRDGRKMHDFRSSGRARAFSRSYAVLQSYVRRPGPESDYHMFPPCEYRADTSPLIQMLKRGHHGVKLDKEAYERLYAWIDLNVPYFGTWSEFRPIPLNQHSRRAEFRKQYAGIDVDYEEIPKMESKPVRPIMPSPPEPCTVTVKCPGWPLDQQTIQNHQQKPNVRKTVSLKIDGQALSLAMIQVPAGEFVMGSRDGAPDAQPPCLVKIDKPFWVSSAFINNAQYAMFDKTHDSRYLDLPGKDLNVRGRPLNRPGQPVVRVSWNRAMDFCDWLSKKTGKKFTLMTEAQWEYACAWKVGLPSALEWTRTDYRQYPYNPKDGRDDGSRIGKKIVRGGNPRSPSMRFGHRNPVTRRLGYDCWQGVWNVRFRVVCLDPDPCVAAKYTRS